MTREFQSIRWETPAAKVARIVLARPETRNAQTSFALHQLGHSHNVQTWGSRLHPSFEARRKEIAARW